MKCQVHPECEVTTKVNDIVICWGCWNRANTEEREWFKKVTGMYGRGLLTRKELDDYLFLIGYHEVDPEAPVNI